MKKKYPNETYHKIIKYIKKDINELWFESVEGSLLNCLKKMDLYDEYFEIYNNSPEWFKDGVKKLYKTDQDHFNGVKKESVFKRLRRENK